MTEELLLRWGVMGGGVALFMWIFERDRAITIAVIASAVLFAVGHLPAIFTLTENAPVSFVLFAIGANFVYGLFFGIIFWRTSLEVAMLAHMSAHVGMMIPIISLFAS